MEYLLISFFLSLWSENSNRTSSSWSSFGQRVMASRASALVTFPVFFFSFLLSSYGVFLIEILLTESGRTLFMEVVCGGGLLVVGVPLLVTGSLQPLSSPDVTRWSWFLISRCLFFNLVLLWFVGLSLLRGCLQLADHGSKFWPLFFCSFGSSWLFVVLKLARFRTLSLSFGW